MDKKKSIYRSFSESLRERPVPMFLLFLFAAVALTLRFWNLCEKPLHHDEAVFGWFILQMWRQGFYHYDPTNYHGPLFFYLLQISEWLFGRDLWSIRAVPALFSSLTCVFFAWLGLFKKPIWWIGALVLLLSPAGEFFGRSGIQECLVAFSEILILYFIREWLQPIPNADEVKLAKKKKWILPAPDPIYITLFGVALAIEFSLKETAAIFVVSLVFAAAFFGFLNRFQNWMALLKENQKPLWNAAGIFILIIVLLFSGFFQNMRGVFDFVAAYLPWLKTGMAGVSGHEKPFIYWSELIVSNEWATLGLSFLALVCWGYATKISRFLLVVAWLQFLIYSIVPYKTPWCLLTIQAPLVFASLCALVDTSKKIQVASAVVLGALAFAGVPMMYGITLHSPIDMEHSYVYVQGSYQYKKMDEFFHANRDLIGDRPLAVAFADFWPFPYSFIDFNLQYMNSETQPDPKLDILFFDSTEFSRVSKALGEGYVSKEFTIRGARGPGMVFIKKDLYAQMKGRWD